MTAEDSRRHQSRTHGQCRTRMIVDDDIKHSGICHDPEVQDAEYEQCRCRAGAGKAALDELCKVVPGVVSGKDEDHTEDHREFQTYSNSPLSKGVYAAKTCLGKLFSQHRDRQITIHPQIHSL